jgi:glycosyltransferase involved in cell wall biosynthesis
LPEVVGDAALLVDPRDEAAIADQILRIYQSPKLRQTLTEKSLQQSQKFSWERCAQATVDVYHQALNS